MIYNRLIVAAIGFIRLEPYDGKLSRTVLRGGKDSNALLLPDYASVEMLYHPELAGKPLAVGGDPEARHGIILTANYIAKKKGVKTGMALWQAKQVCPEIIFVPPRMDLYLRFSQMAREIYSEYTDKIEPYGIDEAWLDVSGSGNLKGRGMTIAREISHRIKYELGVTVSIGISWNKIYAKLGSDYKKPDAITELNRENYKDRIWQLPASDLLYVGRQTNKKLQKLGIRTIGQLAESDEKLLESHFGKIGNVLWAFANGWDEDPVLQGRIGTFSINQDENLTVVANRENIEDREAFARELLQMYKENSFHSTKFSTDRGYATSLDMNIYLWKEDIEDGESVMTAEYRPVEYGKDYDVVNNPDKFQLYIDGKEVEE